MFTYTVEIQTLVGRHLVSPFSISIRQGDKIALIGEEGNGKSLFLKALINDPTLKDLKIVKQMSSNNIVFSYIAQEIPKEDLNKTALDFCVENDWDRYPDFLSEFKQIVGDLDFDRPMNTFSGGERVKIQLVRMRCVKADCLIMDEPSNDLDLETLAFLENWMLEANEPILFVSHDERLIQNVANRILHFEQTHRKTRSLITLYEGGYDDYRSSRDDLIQHHNHTVDNKRRMRDKQMERWRQLYEKVNHRQATNTRQDPSKGRLLKKKMKVIKSMERRLDRDPIDEKRDYEEAISLHFDSLGRDINKRLFTYELKTLKRGELTLGHNYELELKSHDKVACIGRNGIGKTSFFNELCAGIAVDFGVMHQDYRKNLDYNLSAVENLSITHDKEELAKIRLRLGSLKFRDLEMDMKVSQLSGGQKAKISLLRLVLASPPLILLDEPTRNLSPLSVGEIYAMLNDYEGAIFCITHDRNLLSAVFDRVVEFTSDGLIELDWQ